MESEKTTGAETQERRASPVSGREAGGIAAILALALGLRVFHLFELVAHDPFFDAPAVDAGMYHTWASEIAAGDWLGEEVFGNGPAYPYLLGALYALVGPSLFAAKALQAALGAACVAAVWWLGRTLFDARVGLLAAFALAIYGMAIFYGGTLVVANLQTFLGLLALVAFVAALERPRLSRFVWAGVAIGLSATARPDGLVFGGLLALGLLLGVRPGLPLARRAAFAGTFAATAFLVVLPVTLRNYVVSGEVVLVTAAGGLNLYTGNHPGANGAFTIPPFVPRFMADDAHEQRVAFRNVAERVEGRELGASEVSSFYVARTLEWIRAEPGAFARLLLRKLDLSVNAYEPWNIRSITLARDFSAVLRLPLLTFGVLLPLALVGLCWTAPGWRRRFPLYALWISVWTTLLVFFVLARYRLPAVPVLALFAAAACVNLLDAARAKRVRVVAAALIGALAIGAVAQRPIARDDLSVAYYNLGNRYKDSGNWDGAITAYGETLRRRPGYLSARNNLALVYESTGRHREKAIATWRQVREAAVAGGLDRYVERADRHLRSLEGAEPSDQRR